MRRKLSLWLGICAICSCVPTQLQAEGHHQSGVSGQSLIPPHIVEVISPGGNPPVFIVVPAQPIQSYMEVFAETGLFVANVVTSPDGQFALSLKPGTYTLRSLPIHSSNPAAFVETTVVVLKKEWKSVLVSYAYPL
jgi:hypothetical protein